MTHPLTKEMIEQIAQFEPDLTDPLRLNRTNDMRAAYDRAVEDVIKITQGPGWSDYEGTLYYPDDGVENVGDAIRKQLYSQVVDLPQANSDVCGEEGAKRALKRTAEENYEAMRRLADS